MIPTLQIRTLRLSDLATVARLCHTQMQPMSWREAADHLTYRRGIRVAEINGKIVGFTLAVWFEGLDALWLDLIAVDPSQLKAGIGRALLADLEEQASRVGFPRLALATDIDNLAAVRFYERAGYLKDATPPKPGKVGFSKALPSAGLPASSRSIATVAFGSFDGEKNPLMKLTHKARKALLTVWILARRA